jgi:streptothricin acetyltransferase
MPRVIVENGRHRFDEYGQVSIGFLVREIFDAQGVAAMMQGVVPAATPIAEPYWKDYDVYPGSHPAEWPGRFDVSKWTVLTAWHDGLRVGGAVIAIDDRQLDLRDRPGLALLWDIRVAPNMRHRGVGRLLLHAAEVAATERGASALRVETQQVNVAACRFYQRNGYVLERMNTDAYPNLPDEIQLLWLKTLTPNVSIA